MTQTTYSHGAERLTATQMPLAYAYLCVKLRDVRSAEHERDHHVSLHGLAENEAVTLEKLARQYAG